MGVRSFIGELSADQASQLSIAMQDGPFRPERLVQARASTGGWRLFELSMDGTGGRTLCISPERWPVLHDQRFDATTWPGKAIEDDSARIANTEHQRLFEQGGPDQANTRPVPAPGRLRVVTEDEPAKVTPIRAGAAVSTNYPVPEIVEMFERFYEQAKRGEISAAAIAINRPNGAFAVDWASGNARIANLVASVSMLLFRIQRKVAEAMDGQEGAGPDDAG